MPKNETADDQLEPGGKSKLPLIIFGSVVLVAILAVGGIMMINREPAIIVAPPPAEYTVSDKMYQLKDGSYLRLGFSIVTSSSKIEKLTKILEEDSPGRLPDGVNMVVGNKTRDELINGTHKREAFARDLKKMIEERVLAEHNRRQISAKDTIQVEEVLISVFVTQEA